MKIPLPETNELIDINELMEIMDNDLELVGECFKDFISDSPEMLDRIEAAIHLSDMLTTQKAAHAIKGSLKYLAAHKAADIAYQIEKINEETKKDEIKALFSKLIEECEKLKDYMKSCEV